MTKYDCPCCGSKKTVEEEIQGGFGICKICGWEDDGLQTDFPDETGANGELTLESAQKAWAEGKTLFCKYPHP